MDTTDPLSLFVPPVQQWFRATLGEPTPAQRLGWPHIAAGENTLILAPTGSGKTLAAFLACLDTLWRQPELGRGVRILYISPLKALNNDIHRNLQVPLAGVAEVGQRLGWKLPILEAAVRTGDTPMGERQRLIRRPPHILITTPESLHLLLTSRARDTLRGVTHCIVDEIHALCSTKRGVFLALLLERLEALQRDKGETGSFVRIGLSATQRPLEEVARYLGGAKLNAQGQLQPRPVAIVDAGQRKNLDLRVINPVEQFGPLPEKSVWPSIYRLLQDQIKEHRSTIVFANNRRSVERITAFLNENEELARAHHGSVALEVRQQIETALKEGCLPAVVATASLEMGIDMGAVDLVVQVESPGNVARALQRVGRAGHIVGQSSKGRLIPKTNGDLLEQAVLAREMAAGRVEPLRVPSNCLDVLAQQLVALASMEAWPVADLYGLVRQAYPYRDLSPQVFEAVLEMISGRYRFRADETDSGGQVVRPGTLEALQPRVSWDRVHNRLVPLPGSQRHALAGGGTIPDTGQYAAYTGNGVRIGELDEEFIYERRVGDVFLLGTTPWRLERIEADRVVVTQAPGQPGLVPFWRGEGLGRTYDLGLAMGAFLRDLSGRLEQADTQDWLQRECFLDANAARNVRHYLTRQLLSAGCLPTDETLVVEASRDQLGDWQVLLLSPFGSRVHMGLRLAIEACLRRRLGYHPQCLHDNDGVLVRLTDSDEPVLDLLTGITLDNVETLIMDELAESALFALRFRQNAARALLLPRGKQGQRAPLWLQRLRGRDLLQVCRRHADFPIVAETFRECLNDHLDLLHLKELLGNIQAGRVRLVTRRAEVPSPFASGLQFAFTAANVYEQDRVENEPNSGSQLDPALLEQLISPEKQGHLLDPRAVHQVERRLRGLGQPPRSANEMAEFLRRLGDVTEAELEGPMAVFVQELASDGRAVLLQLPGMQPAGRWISTEEQKPYRQAFGLEPAEAEDRRSAGALILARFLDTHALVGLDDVLARYPFERDWARHQLEEWARTGRAVLVQIEGGTMQWSAPSNLEQMQRGTLAVLRREVTTCTPPQFVDFLLRWQHAHPETRQGGPSGLAAALERLPGLPLPAEVWEQAVLLTRVPEYQPRWLEEWTAGGTGVWLCQGSSDNGPGQLAFLPRDLLHQLAAPSQPELGPVDESSNRVLACLRNRGAMFAADLASDSGLSPSVVRTSLWALLRRSLVTNDHFEVIRRGEESPPTMESTSGGRGVRGQGPSMRSLRRGVDRRPEGRWSLLAWGQPDPESQAITQAWLLLQRYGVAARELALMDPWLLPWRVLYEVLSRMELAGEVRRGYFVEGLSGAQFALPEAATLLQDVHLPSTAAAPVILLHSLDPANLYGSGAPLDVPLLDGGKRSFLRRGGNWLVVRAGRPILLVEQQGKKMTALPSSSREEIVLATACLPSMFAYNRGLGTRHKLTVEEWNGEPAAASPGRELLESAGFVRDYQGMTLYAAWR